jgi:hypothetical protein
MTADMLTAYFRRNAGYVLKKQKSHRSWVPEVPERLMEGRKVLRHRESHFLPRNLDCWLWTSHRQTPCRF